MKISAISPERKKQLMRFAAGGGVKTWREDEKEFLTFLNANIPKALHAKYKANAKKTGGRLISDEDPPKSDNPFSFEAILAGMDWQIERMKCAPINEIERAFIDGLSESPWGKKANELEAKKEQAEAAAAATIKDALKTWYDFNPSKMRLSTKANITYAVLLYTTRQDMRSESNIAKAFGVSRKQVSQWFTTFTEATGFKVVTHKNNESVRDHIHGPEHRKNGKIIFHGEEITHDANNDTISDDPFFSER